MGIGVTVFMSRALVSSRPNLGAWTIVNMREVLPYEAIPPIEMGDGAARVAPEFKHLGSVISQSLEGSVTIMAGVK